MKAEIRNWVALDDAVLGCEMSDDEQRTLEAVREIVQQKFASQKKPLSVLLFSLAPVGARNPFLATGRAY
jgi:hypothetical protein